MLCRCYQPNDFTQDIVLMQTWVIVAVCFVFFFSFFFFSFCVFAQNKTNTSTNVPSLQEIYYFE